MTRQTSSRQRRVAALVAVHALAFAAMTAACGSADGEAETTAPTEERLDRQRAEVMAQVLFRNHEAGGAYFRVAARSFEGVGTITLDGVVDWTLTLGRATVAGVGDDLGEVSAVAWGPQVVAEYRPGLDGVLQGLGHQPGTFLGRDRDMTRRLDQLLAIVSGLASTTPDNPQLILQNPGAAFLRTDTLRGRTVDVMRYSERSVFWVDTETLHMMRFEGTDSSGRFPVVVDIIELLDEEFEMPPAIPIPDQLRR